MDRISRRLDFNVYGGGMHIAVEDVATRSVNLKIALTYFLILISAQLIFVYMLLKRPTILMGVIVGLTVGLILPVVLGLAVNKIFKAAWKPIVEGLKPAAR